jgi:hypothetical protein
MPVINTLSSSRVRDQCQLLPALANIPVYIATCRLQIVIHIVKASKSPTFFLGYRINSFPKQGFHRFTIISIFFIPKKRGRLKFRDQRNFARNDIIGPIKRGFEEKVVTILLSVISARDELPFHGHFAEIAAGKS